ncbi:hypothetical protein [Promicromonospora sp. NFX87]|uniref:hypothetical protein n=1 Tax=Promicromonospora sp. NFX87 TaxID=3402691 RepID=UPI003AFB0194
MTAQSAAGPSTTGPFLPQRKPLHRRVWFWVVLGVLALPVLAIVGLVVLFLTTGGWSAPKPPPAAHDCGGAIRAAGLKTLPVDADTNGGPGAGATCASGGFQDPYVTIDFVAPQDDVDAWLLSELPWTEPEPGHCVDGDTCLQFSGDELETLENGWNLNISTTDQGDGTVAVAVRAFTM